MKTMHLMAVIGALGTFGFLSQDIAQARERYLERGAPMKLTIETTPENPWLAISELPPLDMGNRVATNTTQQPKVEAASQETPKFTEIPEGASTFGPVAPAAVQELSPAELLGRLRIAPGDTNGIFPAPLNFVPPSRPSSTATYSKTK